MDKVCEECGQVFMTNRSARRYCPGRRCSNAVIAREREDRRLNTAELKTVWSCGGGVQSTAIAALICEGKLPRPDYALMTDCGYEKQATMEYVRGTLVPSLKAVGVELNLLRTLDYANNDVVNAGGLVRIPAYTRTGSGSGIKFKTFCSDAWKVRVAHKWMREQGIALAENWVGISTDELRRQRLSPKRWITNRYPLVELGLSREDCLWFICEHGWPRPPRTSCLCCPQQDDASWATTKREYPDDWQRAVEIEQSMQKVVPDVYLHRSLVPLNEVQLRC